MRHLYLSAVLVALVAGLTGQAEGARLGMDREAYGVYDRKGGNSIKEYPFNVGQALKQNWDNSVNPSRGTFDWSELDSRLQLAYDQNQRFYLHLHLSKDKDINGPPAWIYSSGVPMVEGFGTEVYPYYLDEDFKTYFSEMIADLGDHVRNQVPAHLQDLISFVRVDCGIHGDDRPYDNVSYIPEVYQISKEDWLQFKFFAYEVYKQAFQEGPGYIVPLMFKHASSLNFPDEWEWIQTNINHSYGARYLGDVRGHHLTGSQLTTTQFKDMAVDSDVGLFSRNEMDETWEKTYFQLNIRLNMYWNAVEQLHPGLSIWDVSYSCLQNTYIDDYAFVFDFFNKWSAELIPATAGGGFCIFHEGLDSSDTVKFPEGVYGTASQSNTNRYAAICNDPVYAARGAQMDDLYGATLHQVPQRDYGLTGFNDAGWEIVPGNYERFITQLDPENTSIGLFRMNGPLTTTSHPYDRFGRSFESASGKNTMYFDVNDDLIDSTTQRTRLSVVYLDRGTGSFELQYDAFGNSQKTAFVVNKTNSNTWKTNSVVVTDGVFGNNGPNGADLMLLNLDADDDIFHMLELIKLADVELDVVGQGQVTARHGSTTYAPVSGVYMEGQRLDLTATPGQGWEFSGWTGDFAETRDNWARLYPTELTQVSAEFAFTGRYLVFDDFESNTWNGGEGWSGNWSRSGGTTLSNDEYNTVVLLDSNGQITRTLSRVLTNASLSFVWDADSIDSGESAQVEVYDGSWHVVWTVTDADNGSDNASSPGALAAATIDLSAYDNISMVRFTLNAGGSFDLLWLDDIEIAGYDVNANNTTPTFLSDPITTPDAFESALYTASLSGVGFDADGDSLTYSMVSEPSWLNVAPNGDLSGIPGYADVGENVFAVQVDDGSDGSDTAVLRISVQGAVPPSLFTADFSGSRFQTVLINQGDPIADPYGGLANLNDGTEFGSWSAASLEESSVYTNASGDSVLFAGTGAYDLQADFEAVAAISNQIDIALNFAVCRTGTGAFPIRRNFITGVDGSGQPAFKLLLSGWAGDDGGKTLYLVTAGSTNLLASNIARFAKNDFTDAELGLLEVTLDNAGVSVSLDGIELTNSVPFYTAGVSTLSALVFEGDSTWYDNIEVNTSGTTLQPYDTWAESYALTNAPAGDDDLDGLSNLAEYALNGNPTNASDKGSMEIHADNAWFSVVHASNTVDGSLVYRLIERTNLVSGAVNTNNWDSQSFGAVDGDYVTVSNHYSTAGKPESFIQLEVEQQ